MSVSGISSSTVFNDSTQGVQSPFQQFQQDFQQLGQALQSGNLSAAQADFVTLQQLNPQPTSTAEASNNNPIAQGFTALAQDLQNGNLSAAQQQFATIQQDFQNQGAQGSQEAHGHHHHHEGGDWNQDSANSPTSLFGQLGQELQSGSLSSAQQTYAALQQEFQQSGQASTVEPQSTAIPTTSTISVSA
jgi:hypothetical protein